MITEEYRPKTLEEYLQFYKKYGYQEQAIVELYLMENKLEVEYANTVIRLLQSALYRERSKNAITKEVIQYNAYCGEIHNVRWTQEENTLWDKWLLEYALNYELSESTKNTIKEKVPNMLMPEYGFRGLLAYINKECGVLFKDQTKADDFDLLKVPEYYSMSRW